MSHRHARVRGSTLVEVLVTVLIISLGLLGMARLQTAAIVHSHDAWLQAEAVRLSAQMLDKMRANRSAVLAGCYDHPAPACDTGSDGLQRAQAELQHWLHAVDHRLPSASARIGQQQDAVFIELRWHERGEFGGGYRELRTGTRP